ncbi:helix-turn-helix transcriptional regulator [Thalassobius sp. S69A]|uniref:helix-turn-helix transcriptional regulator n=1 Tax=unclassified Thalassovita TaxID=2619711 RepID=UPI000C486CA9|nr:hypothetical protein [Paracoccaceae bacterium]
MASEPSLRTLQEAERFTPPLLYQFLSDLETTTQSLQVWQLLVSLGKSVGLPFIDFIAASSYAEWRRTLFIRTSYDSSWLSEVNKDPEVQKWSTFRCHAMHHLTPIMMGLEFAQDYDQVAPKRLQVLEMAAARGIRAGFSIPLRIHAPPQAALISFSGDHTKEAMIDLLARHGWTLHVAAMAAHQRYMLHFSNEFFDRNEITAKQRELLKMVGQGLQDKQIAADLGISVSALRQRMHSLMVKADLGNRAEIAALAMCTGLLPDPQFTVGSLDILVEMDDTGIRTRGQKE